MFFKYKIKNSCLKVKCRFLGLLDTFCKSPHNHLVQVVGKRGEWPWKLGWFQHLETASNRGMWLNCPQDAGSNIQEHLHQSTLDKGLKKRLYWAWSRPSGMYVLYVLVSQCVWLFETPWTIASARENSSVRWILKARILEWVAIPFSRGSFQPKDQTWVSCIAGRFFTIWATRVKPLFRSSPRQDYQIGKYIFISKIFPFFADDGLH